jgi:hypothetical protein
VSIVPMLIGVPVAATPGFDPQAEVLVLVLAVVELVVLVVAGVLLDVELLVVLLELLPQPASASAPTIKASAAVSRTREPCMYFLTCLSSF